MTDIVTRLRTWFKDVNAVSAIDLMDEAAAEIERLRRGGWRAIADGEPPLSRVLVTRKVNGYRYVDVVNWITEPDSGLPKLNPTLSQVTHWQPLPEPPEVTK